MKNRDAFSAFHPAVLCGYYALVLVFSMFLTHPLCLAASLLGALGYAARLRGGRAVLRSLAWMAPVWLLAAAVNTLFNHEGATILTYFSSGNPLTLESMLYGLSAGGMLAAVLLWFTTYQAVMTSDKFVYLFGRAIPALSLVLSMTLRFVPKFRAQLRAVQQARQFAGNSEKTGPIQKVRTSVENFSILVTWSLENAVETADSMRARGYGEARRTTFHLFRFDTRSAAIMAAVLSLAAVCTAGRIYGYGYMEFYPRIYALDTDAGGAAMLAAYAAVMFMGAILEMKEAAVWRSCGLTE